MSRSFVELEKRGFWANDTALELWLYFFARRALESGPPAWLETAANDWLQSATGGRIGWVHAELDQYCAQHPQRKQHLVTLAEQVLEALPNQTGAFSTNFLNSIELAWNFEGELPVDNVLQVGRIFVALIEGKVTTDAKSAETFPRTLGAPTQASDVSR